MDNTLKSRISGAEQTAGREESPIAALFKRPPMMEAERQPEDKPQAPAAPGKSTTRRDLPASLLDEMEQPFRIYEGKKLEQMRDSIIAHGIIEPLVVWPNPEHPGRYQIISGRHRRRAAILAAYTMLPCEIKNNIDATEARLQMLVANLDQRDELLPSEKAWAYRERLELLSHQGKRTDIEKSQNGSEALGEKGEETSGNICQKWARDEIADGEKNSARTIQNYIRLTYLISELLEEVDAEHLGISAGVTLSYLSPENQAVVYQYFFVDHKQKIGGSLAEVLRSAGEKEPITEKLIARLLLPVVKKAKPLRKVAVNMKPLRSFFPAEATPKEIEKQIIEILTEYFSKKS